MILCYLTQQIGISSRQYLGVEKASRDRCRCRFRRATAASKNFGKKLTFEEPDEIQQDGRNQSDGKFTAVNEEVVSIAHPLRDPLTCVKHLSSPVVFTERPRGRRRHQWGANCGDAKDACYA